MERRGLATIWRSVSVSGRIGRERGGHIASWSIGRSLAVPVLVLAEGLAVVGASSPAGTATFGNPRVGAVGYPSQAGKKRVSRYRLSGTVDVRKLTAYLAGAGRNGSQVLRDVIYGDANGQPGILLATTKEITVKARQGPAWRNLPFPATVRLDPGTYWLGFISGNKDSRLKYYYNEFVGDYRSNNDAYTDGPRNTFGASTTAYKRNLSIYATYTKVVFPVVAAAGDIACDPSEPEFNGGRGTTDHCRMKATSDLLLNVRPAAVLTLGDEQYECGGYNAFLQSFGPTWGRLRSIVHPIPSDHDYKTSGGTDCDASGAAGGYFRYFGAAAGDPAKGYYSFDIGTWHVIALNSTCPTAGGCGAGSPEELWLKSDLAAHPQKCTLVTMHQPRFSSGLTGDDPTYADFWQDLYEAGADIVLTGKDHDYERFAPQTPDGVRDTARGIREFVVGTGGRTVLPVGTIRPNSEVRNNKAFGVLLLTLKPTSYGWQFVSVAGGTFTDSGSTACH
jgi:acid phosphatase type 7